MNVKIVSVSMSEETLKELDSMVKEAGFSGRSDAVRSALRSISRENKRISSMRGEVDCILIAVHGQHNERDVTKIKHEYEDVIRTQVHSNLRDSKCLELFVLNGPAERVKELYRKCRSSKKIDYADLIVS